MDIYIYIIQIHMIRIDSLDDLHKAQPRPGVTSRSGKLPARQHPACRTRPRFDLLHMWG